MWKRKNTENVLHNKSSVTISSPPDDIGDPFKLINERPVNDISLEFCYKPHSILVLAVSIPVVFYVVFNRDENSFETNVWAGFLSAVYFFLVISVLTFPNGPFIRPHPAVWRILFGCSVLYLLILQFSLFQNYETIRNMFFWFDPELKDFHINMEKEYGVNCSDITIERVVSHLDVFAWGHFLGWASKALMIRHAGILVCMSVMWEITELAFAHLLPNFVECWWDALVLDVLLCNGAGIWFGLRLCKIFEMREYKWSSVKNISTTTGKIKRVMLQFTPESWHAIRWLDPHSTPMRFAAVAQMILFWQLTELNTFFLKQIFEMPPDHYLVIGRLVFIALIAQPTFRQYYTYVTDPKCKRLATQCWVYVAITISESFLCIKNGKDVFENTDGITVLFWLILQAVFSVIFVCACILWQRLKITKKHK